MKRIGLLVLVVVLAVFTVWYLKRDDKYSTLGKDNDFAVKDTARISRIFLVDRNGQKADLVRKGRSWIINNKYKVNPYIMDVFMKTIYGLETQLRPPKNAVQTMVKDLAAQAVKTEIYNDDNELIRSYYVGGVTPDESGTYFIMEGEDQPFVVGVVGKDGGVKVSYFTDEEKWRDKTVFDLKVDEIKSVEVDYPKLKNKSFRLTKTATGYEVVPLNASAPKSNKPLKAFRVEQYLSGFKKQIASDLVNRSQIKEQVIQNLPFASVTVEDIRGVKRNVKLFAMIDTDHEGKEILDASGNHKPIEKFYAYADNRDFLIVQEMVFGKVFWEYSYFFE